MKKLVMIMAMMVFGLMSFNGPSLIYAESEAAAVDAGNKICPITGEAVEGKHFVEYQGKKYGICCPMCAKKFNQNPEKYLAELEKSKTA